MLSFSKRQSHPLQGVGPARGSNAFCLLHKQRVWTPFPVIVLHSYNTSLQRYRDDFVAHYRTTLLGFLCPVHSVEKSDRTVRWMCLCDHDASFRKAGDITPIGDYCSRRVVICACTRLDTDYFYSPARNIEHLELLQAHQMLTFQNAIQTLWKTTCKMQVALFKFMRKQSTHQIMDALHALTDYHLEPIGIHVKRSLSVRLLRLAMRLLRNYEV